VVGGGRYEYVKLLLRTAGGVVRAARLHYGLAGRYDNFFVGVNFIPHSGTMNLATVVRVWWGVVLQPLPPSHPVSQPQNIIDPLS
jgi:hypothetical protein